MSREIKVFNYPWHVAHQWSLLKIPFKWHYLLQHTRKWSESARPLPEHVEWVTHYESGKYDFALLHVDQQCLSETLARGKTILFREMKELILGDIPIVVINHGTPVYPEAFIQMAQKDGYGSSEEDGERWAREHMEELLEGVDKIVVNSHKAAEQWGFGKPIIHGMDADEWWDLPKEPRITVVISPAGMGEKYYGRRFLRNTRNILENKYGIHVMWVGEHGFAPSWNHYRKYLGSSLVYFNPTIGSPMSRARTEAMLSGCCVVTTKHHGADDFIEHGKNGFICKLNPDDAAEKLAWCMNHYKESVEIGQRGKETAKKLFKWERFRDDWLELVGDLLGEDLGYLKNEKNEPNREDYDFFKINDESWILPLKAR